MFLKRSDFSEIMTGILQIHASTSSRVMRLSSNLSQSDFRNHRPPLTPTNIIKRNSSTLQFYNDILIYFTKIMVKTCSWGKCNSDTRYPERIHGVRFIPFPKPKTNEAKCLRWIKACGRPHWQFGQSSINRHTFVCSKVSFLYLFIREKNAN